jgi:acyl CoA:acetate/3-ketoacid CoA transferase beta subunit
VYSFDQASKRLALLSLHPGIDVDEVQAHSEFEILIPSEVPVTHPPTAEERRILHEIDPAGMVLGK